MRSTMRTMVFCACLALGLAANFVRAEEAAVTANRDEEESIELSRRKAMQYTLMLEREHDKRAAKARTICVAGLGVLLAAVLAGVFLLRRWWLRGLLLAGAMTTAALWVSYWGSITF